MSWQRPYTSIFGSGGAWAPPGPAGNDATDVIGCPGPISIREGMHSEIGERPDRHGVTGDASSRIPLNPLGSRPSLNPRCLLGSHSNLHVLPGNSHILPGIEGPPQNARSE